MTTNNEPAPSTTADPPLDDIENLTMMMMTTKPTVVVATPIDVPFAIAPLDAFATQKIATAVRVDECASEDVNHSGLVQPTLLTVTDPTRATVNVSQAKTSKCHIILNCVAVVFVGVFLGLITFIPNMMMGDSGSTSAIRAAYMGMAASACMAVGGIVGGIVSACGRPCASWLCILPGVGLEILMFLIL
jgi:hypothetical protein